MGVFGENFSSGRPVEWGASIPHLISLSLCEASFEGKERISFTVLEAFHVASWNFLFANFHIKRKNCS